MRQFELRVAELAAIGGSIRIECTGPGPRIAPGQVCMALANLPGQPFLRLPLFLLTAQDAKPSFFVPLSHPYARLAPGARLDLIGPAGRGFRLPPEGGHLLVIASGLERLAPVVEDALHRRLAVTVLTPRGAEMLPSDVEIQRGPLNAEMALWADLVALDVSDPVARAERVRALAPGRGPEYVQAIHAPLMPCGVGACQACWVQLAAAHVRKLACVDGPVFSF